jgi:acyl carrier protein
MEEIIRAIIAEHGRLPVEMSTVSDSDDLFEIGMTSHSTVNVMLALEDEFDVEFPEEMLKKGTFESVVAIKASIGQLSGS